AAHQHGVSESDGQAGLDDGDGPDGDAGIVAAGQLESRRTAGLQVHRPLRQEDARGRLDGDVAPQWRAGATAAEDASRVVRRGGDLALADRERVVVAGAAHLGGRESGAKLDAFDGGDGEEEM